MKVVSHQLTSSLEPLPGQNSPNTMTDLVLVHGTQYIFEQPTLLKKLCEAFPNACIAGCSGAGELLNGEAFDNSVVYSAIEFSNTSVRQARINPKENKSSDFESGRLLAQKLTDDDLVAVILFSDAIGIDCDELVKGIDDIFGQRITVVGGLAGGSSGLEYSVVLDRDGVYDDAVVAVGIYGKNIEVNTTASVFDKEGSDIEITSTDGNLIREINGRPALTVYEELTGDYSHLAYPSRYFCSLIILSPESKEELCCRFVLEYHKETGALLASAGVPEGPAKLIKMFTPEDFLSDANITSLKMKNKPAEFALVVSCAGRRVILDKHWTKEFSLVQENLGNIPSLGFYSFGEIGMSNIDNSTIVHNQTLTIATFTETDQ